LLEGLVLSLPSRSGHQACHRAALYSGSALQAGMGGRLCQVVCGLDKVATRQGEQAKVENRNDAMDLSDEWDEVQAGSVGCFGFGQQTSRTLKLGLSI
jgi:hypothetical protein